MLNMKFKRRKEIIKTYKNSLKLEEKIFNNLKSELLKLAQNGEKGCKINLIDIADETKKSLIKLLKKEKIKVFQNSYLIWDKTAIQKKTKKPDPCIKCPLSKSDKFWCWGCNVLENWVESDGARIVTTYNITSEFSISSENNEVSIIKIK